MAAPGGSTDEYGSCDGEQLAELRDVWPQARVIFDVVEGENCRFPLWDLRRPYGEPTTTLFALRESHRYVCGAPPLPGRPYCRACYQRLNMTAKLPSDREVERVRRALAARAGRKRW